MLAPHDAEDAEFGVSRLASQQGDNLVVFRPGELVSLDHLWRHSLVSGLRSASKTRRGDRGRRPCRPSSGVRWKAPDQGSGANAGVRPTAKYVVNFRDMTLMSRDQSGDHGLKDHDSVARSHQGFDGVLRMRHQSHDIALFIQNARD